MMNEATAQTIALNVLTWLAGDDDLFAIFMGSSGMSAQELAQRAGEAEVLAAVLDFVTMDDAWVLRWAEETGGAPTAPMEARMALPGGAQVNWT
ncbi:DUF3572 domain-containing protein [Celeribacter sp.]|uniref:DUF3572 domain-containing protein n=1 Tax=Celeribacter sp. TaxID=1890673 RepID=UPI003A92F03C